MSTLALTIDRAMGNIGQTARGVLRETLGAFENLWLTDEERVSAVATALATTAIVHHHRHVAKFLDAVRIWSLEAGDERVPPLPTGRPARAALVAEGATLVCGGTDALLDALARSRVPLEDRVVAELTLYTRLLERTDIHTVLDSFRAIGDALATPGFRAGSLVRVVICRRLPVARDADLAGLPTCGIA